mmetsp:Transcript_16537/g.56350  ORF Transcript_16537/g.56350 Transcript_16537/m.56350 type:complete len:151 (+) Transcript_16537:406-858(+)
MAFSGVKGFFDKAFGGGSTLTAEAAEVQENTVEFWDSPERCGWLMKQGEVIKTWRKRWFVLKQGKIFWFKSDAVTKDSVPRGILDVSKCLTVRGAEDTLNKATAFEISSRKESMYFIADSAREKEDWINSIGRAIVRHSSSLQEEEVMSY